MREMFFLSYRLVFWAAVAVLTAEDYRTKEIHTWIPASGILAGGILTAVKGTGVPETAELVCFFLLQLFLFSRLYGFGDCLVFMMCALYLRLYHDGGLTDDLILMLTAYCLLLAVQLARRNVAGRNLKNPVAMIPYITAALIINTAAMSFSGR